MSSANLTFLIFLPPRGKSDQKINYSLKQEVIVSLNGSKTSLISRKNVSVQSVQSGQQGQSEKKDRVTGKRNFGTVLICDVRE